MAPSEEGALSKVSESRTVNGDRRGRRSTGPAEMASAALTVLFVPAALYITITETAAANAQDLMQSYRATRSAVKNIEEKRQRLIQKLAVEEYQRRCTMMAIIDPDSEANKCAANCTAECSAR